MKKVVSVLMILVLCLTSSLIFTGCPKNEDGDFAHDGFYVEGTKLYDANGKEFVMRGINVAHAWYKSFTDDSLKRCAELGCNTVRVCLAEGSQYEEDIAEDVQKIIKKCKELNMIAVLEPHDFTGMNRIEDIDYAVTYWKKLYDVLKGEEAYVIINIANEWCGEWTTFNWKEGYVKAIKELRDFGFKHTFMIDCAGYAQYAKSIFASGKEVYEADPTGNTMFSIHMYDNAGGSETVVKRNIDKTLDLGLCLCIGEFSCEHKGNEVEEEYIMKYTTDMGVGYIAWSYAGNGSGLQPLDVTVPWTGELTEWGKYLVEGEGGLKETSVICSVFDTNNKVNAANKTKFDFDAARKSAQASSEKE